jgi:hypothetical protein
MYGQQKSTRIFYSLCKRKYWLLKILQQQFGLPSDIFDNILELHYDQLMIIALNDYERENPKRYETQKVIVKKGVCTNQAKCLQNQSMDKSHRNITKSTLGKTNKKSYQNKMSSDQLDLLAESEVYESHQDCLDITEIIVPNSDCKCAKASNQKLCSKHRKSVTPKSSTKDYKEEPLLGNRIASFAYFFLIIIYSRKT